MRVYYCAMITYLVGFIDKRLARFSSSVFLKMDTRQKCNLRFGRLNAE